MPVVLLVAGEAESVAIPAVLLVAGEAVSVSIPAVLLVAGEAERSTVAALVPSPPPLPPPLLLVFPLRETTVNVRSFVAPAAMRLVI